MKYMDNNNNDNRNTSAQKKLVFRLLRQRTDLLFFHSFIELKEL